MGVDLGGTKLLAGAVDEQLDVHHRTQRIILGLDQAGLIDAIAEAVGEVVSESGREVAAVGFGIPCMIDQRDGHAILAVNLPIADLMFRDVMGERLGLPVVIDNDGNCAALAEHRFGAARGSQHSITLTVGTGIGGGMVLGGRVYRGAIGAGAEMGHMVIDMDGPRCQGNCPNYGCLEAVASGTALEREARRVAATTPETPLGRELAAGREPTGPRVTELAHDGDPQARDLLALIGERLGVGIANYVNIFGPEVVVIGGGVIAAGEHLLAPARAVLAKRALPPLAEGVRVVAARFGNDAGMLGAATLALESLSGDGA